MLIQLITFELRYHIKNILFLIGALSFTFFGFMLIAYGIKIPMVDINAPYLIGYCLGLTSIGAIFLVSLFGANAVLKDKESKMDSIINAMPVSKFQFLSAKITGLVISAFLCCSFIVLGMALAPLAHSVSPDRLTEIPIIHYGYNLLVIMLPNVLLFSAFILAIASITQNRIAVYVGGVLIYVLYMAGAIFSNAPWMANASPASSEAISLAAMLDPLGLSAFFEQTKGWSTQQMNTQSIVLSGNFLLNRLIWFGISIISLMFTYRYYSFNTLKVKKKKKSASTLVEFTPQLLYTPIISDAKSIKAQRQMWWSLFKIELKNIIKSIPFIIILMLWAFIYGMELYGMLSGGRRMEGPYPLTANMVNQIMDLLPMFGLLVVIFYSNEQIWRKIILKIDTIYDAAPVRNFVLYSSNFVALCIISILLISISILISILVQLTMGYMDIEPLLYAKVFYYAGLPLVLVAALSLLIQSLVHNRYLGMVLTALLVLLINSPLSVLVGIEHPLMRYAAPLFTLAPVDYSDFNGFGDYARAFHWRMLYSLAWAIIFGFLTYGFWKRGKAMNIQNRMKQFRQYLNKRSILLMAAAVCLLLGSGGFIFYQTNIWNEYYTIEEKKDWSVNYETLYKEFENMPQPIITSVKSAVDLFPSEQRYKVKANYKIINKENKPIKKALLYLHRASQLDSIYISGAHLSKSDEEFGHFWINFDQPLLQEDQRDMYFEFNYSWSGFNEHILHNAIIQNGSFMRISNYFPQFGYNTEMEISNEDTRKALGLQKREEHINTIAEFEKDKANGKKFHDYIEYETVVSTEAPQTAIGQGNLLKKWAKNDRNYFHYKMDRPIPFRFAFATARYSLKKANHNDTEIEIYYHPKHGYNVDRIITAIKQTLDYCNNEFGDYQYEHFRYVEVASFTGGFAATAYPNSIYHNEKVGFISKIEDSTDIDVIAKFVGHELGHQWWGGQLDAPVMEGGIVLSETLAQYTEIMIYKNAYQNQKLVTDALTIEQDIYLSSRGFEEEVPLYKAVYNHPHIPYSKGLKVMYAVQDLIGEQELNKVLRTLIEKFAYPKNPPSVEDFLTELYKVTPENKHALLDDWFKKIVVYDLAMDKVKCTALTNGKYQIDMVIKAKKFEEDGFGNATEEIIDQALKIGVYTGDKYNTENVLYLQPHQITGELTELTLTVNKRPTSVVVDPNKILIDIDESNNEKWIK